MMFDFPYMQSQQYFTLLLLFTGKKREGVQLGLGESVVMQLAEKIQNLQCQVLITFSILLHYNINYNKEVFSV